MSSKKDYSKKILRILGKKSTVSMPLDSLAFGVPPSQEEKNAMARAIQNLIQAGCIEKLNSGRKNYLRITPKGKTKLDAIKLEGEEALVAQTWDGLWRVILLDLPEERKSERESLRYLLKKAGFVCLKNSAWISPFPYEHLFVNIKKDLGLTTEMMIIVTEFIDEESKKVLFETFRK